MDFKRKYLKYKYKYLRLKQLGGNEKLPEDILTIINSFNDCNDIIKYLFVNKTNINNITSKVWNQLIKYKDFENFNVEQSEFVKAKMCNLITDVESKNKCYEFYTKCLLKYLLDKYDISDPKKAWYESIRQGNVDDYKLFDTFTDIKTIDKRAFHRDKLFYPIKKVTIPDSVTIIGKGAFSKNDLKNVIIPDSVTTIDQAAFRNNELTSLTIGKSVTTIGKGAFFKNKLKSVIIPDSVTIIDHFAFAWNELTSLKIPNSVKTIGKGAFFKNKLESVVIPNSVITISELAFGYNKLTSLEIPNSVEFISKGAFRNNELKFVKIPDNVFSTFLTNESFDPQVNIQYKNNVLPYNSYLWPSVINFT